ncbi:MAG TPA: DinB family protein, partial [Gemmatimonadales bacterium]|nr:DinB family protein [Gemmatimonadales bacterium]
MIDMARPAAGEFAPAYAGYVGRIADGEDILAVLIAQLGEVSTLLGAMPDAVGDHRYAPGKWSIKEIVGHLADAERIFAYRALRFGRGDPTALPAFDENAYVPAMEADACSLADYVAEWADVRRATISLFEHLPAAAWPRRGTAS